MARIATMLGPKVWTAHSLPRHVGHLLVKSLWSPLLAEVQGSISGGVPRLDTADLEDLLPWAKTGAQ
eukprot:3890542-Alexandrium_andersonii.AAC.1